MKAKIQVVIADDHPVARAGLIAMLKAAPHIRVVGEAADGNEAVALALQHKPNVVLMDVRMPKKDGLEALAAIRRKSPDQAVVMVTAFGDRANVVEAIRHGAADFVLKDVSAEELIATIERAAAGEPPPETSHIHVVRRLNRRSQKRDDADCPLTNRELQILRNVSLGLSNREIGDALEISVETVKEHVQNALRKLNVTSRTQAAVMAINHGWV